MSGVLEHSPADIIRQVMIDIGIGTDPEDEGAWPVYASGQPIDPDECLTVYDTQGRDLARCQIDGKRYEHHGFQIRVRGIDHQSGYLKARSIAVQLDAVANVHDRVVALDEDNLYQVQSVCRTSDVISMGKDGPTSKLSIFTINGVAPIRMVS